MRPSRSFRKELWWHAFVQSEGKSRWIAQDPSGFWSWFESKPTIGESGWSRKHMEERVGVFHSGPAFSWEDSLEEAPKEQVDWALMPSWANFVACNKQLHWMWYEREPLRQDGYEQWAVTWTGDEQDLYGEIPIRLYPFWFGDWRDSLQRRPK